ncbi:MAG: adenosine kinase [Victivallales bacterium]|nr:adenosine kinase [Victivallales bacterium]
MDGEKHILGLGSAIMDLLYHVPDDFMENVPGLRGGTMMMSADEMDTLIGKIPSDGRIVQGGSAANTIVALAMLGDSTSLLCKLGNDSYGARFKEALLSSNVSDSNFKYSPLPTGRCLSLITPDSERTMRTCMGAAETMSPDDLSMDDFPHGGIFLIEGYSIFNKPMLLKAIELAKANGMEIHLDLASPEIAASQREFLLGMIPGNIHTIYANEMEAQAISNKNAPQEALDFIAEICDIAIVKLGRKGAMIKRHSGETTCVPAQIVNAIDTTAAGDLWAAGFLHGYVNGWPIEKAAALGAATSAEVVQVTGSVLPKETWEKLRQF